MNVTNRLLRRASPLALMLALFAARPAPADAAATKGANPNEPTVVSVITPPGFVRAKPVPVLIALPPGGQTAELAKAMLDRYWGAEAKRRGWVVISLAARPGRLMFEPNVAKLVDGVVDRALSASGVVPSRLALGGVSNGGLSAFRLALDRPERYSALVVLPGFPPNGSRENVTALKRLRVAMWVGANDTSWVSPMRAARDTLQSAGGAVTLVEVANSEHIIDNIVPSELFDALEAKP